MRVLHWLFFVFPSLWPGLCQRLWAKIVHVLTFIQVGSFCNCFRVKASCRVPSLPYLVLVFLVSCRQQRSARTPLGMSANVHIASFVICWRESLNRLIFRFECGWFSLAICWHHSAPKPKLRWSGIPPMVYSGKLFACISHLKRLIAAQSHWTVIHCERCLAILQSFLSPVSSLFPSPPTTHTSHLDTH